MSAKHPVIAVTGSSGAGTTTTSLAFRKIFAQLNLHAAEVEGDSFHRYTRPEMDMAIRKARDAGRHISYFGPEANDFGLLNKPSLNMVRAAKGNLANICIPTTKPYRGIRYRGHSPHGNLYRNPLMYCFMKVYTAASSRHSITLRSMWTYWSAWCLSLTLSGFKN